MSISIVVFSNYIYKYIVDIIVYLLYIYMNYTSQSDNMILRTTLVSLASFSFPCQQSVGFTCYPQVCFGSVTM